MATPNGRPVDLDEVAQLVEQLERDLARARTGGASVETLQAEVEPIFSAIRNWLTSNLAWFFIGAANIFVLLCLGLIVSPLGKVRLGGREATADYSYAGWFSMLFAAGMGIGLMFYGVSEPMSHYSSAMGGITVGEDGVRTDWAPLGGAGGVNLLTQIVGTVLVVAFALLTSVLTYHVTPGNADPRKGIFPSKAKTLQGQTVFVGYDKDGASVNQSVASCTGVKTTNGTVWVIDSVLLPQFK